MLERMRSRLVAVAAASALLLSACSSDEKPAPDPEPSDVQSSPAVEVSPLTGRPFGDGAPDNPVLVVKIENTAAGAPQHGLEQADLVVEELVEGGLTRLAAIYYENMPEQVGHVRSMRASDIGIAAPVGGQVVASGGASSAYQRLEAAGVPVFSEDHDAPGFSSDPVRARPYNRLVDLRAIAAVAERPSIPGPYLTWRSADDDTSGASPSDSTESTRATSATVRFSPTTSTSWALDDGTWRRTNGHAEPGTDFAADTMVVVFCEVGDAGYTDPAGNPVPETIVEGDGRAVIFADDEVTEATWSKKTLSATMTFEDPAGEPLSIDPGHVWLELVPQDGGDVTLG